MNYRPWRPAEGSPSSLKSLIDGQMRRVNQEIDSLLFPQRIAQEGRDEVVEALMSDAAIPIFPIDFDKWVAVHTQVNLSHEAARRYGIEPTNSGQVTTDGVNISINYRGEYDIIHPVLGNHKSTAEAIGISSNHLSFTIPRVGRSAQDMRLVIDEILSGLKTKWDSALAEADAFNNSLQTIIEAKVDARMNQASSTEDFLSELNQRGPAPSN